MELSIIRDLCNSLPVATLTIMYKVCKMIWGLLIWILFSKMLIKRELPKPLNTSSIFSCLPQPMFLIKFKVCSCVASLFSSRSLKWKFNYIIDPNLTRLLFQNLNRTWLSLEFRYRNDKVNSWVTKLRLREGPNQGEKLGWLDQERLLHSQ